MSIEEFLSTLYSIIKRFCFINDFGFALSGGMQSLMVSISKNDERARCLIYLDILQGLTYEEIENKVLLKLKSAAELLYERINARNANGL